MKRKYDEYQVQKVYSILLEHKGSTNPIKAKIISNVVGFPMDDTQAICRRIIRDIAERYNLPIVATRNGYYIAESQVEIENYIKYLDSKIEGIEERKRLILHNF